MKLNDRVLALYDVTGIQSYIFQTKKLKDIMGASALVGDALGDIVRKILGGHSFPQDALIYSGGGNAIIGFGSCDDWKAFNRTLTRKLMTDVPGLSIVTVCNEKSGDNNSGEISERVKRLFAEIAKKKVLGGNSCSTCTLSPMAQSGADKMPISVIEITNEGTEEYSYAGWVKNDWGKREADKRSEDPKDFDTIAEKPAGYEDAERLMAVVHIDGNNMGQIFKRAHEQAKSLADITALSVAVSEAFNTAIEALWVDDNVETAIPTQSRRMIYHSGDDVTYVCHGIYALNSVIRFMKALEVARMGDERIKDLSASAGIAYVKPHFPFYRAYTIAEDCCKAAKNKARIEYSQRLDFDVGSWVNFEIIRGSDNKGMLGDSYMRPYCIVSPDTRSDKDCHIDKLIACLDIVKSGARSKWKTLRNSYLLGGTESVWLLMKSCNIERPSTVIEEKVVFDALDLMDVLVPIGTDEQVSGISGQEGAQ